MIFHLRWRASKELGWEVCEKPLWGEVVTGASTMTLPTNSPTCQNLPVNVPIAWQPLVAKCSLLTSVSNDCPLLGSKSCLSRVVQLMLCHKCHQSGAADGDTWCLGCAGWEALGRELCSSWPAEGARRLAADLVISCTRQVRGLRNFSQAVRSNQVSARATSRVREPGDHEVEAERPELKRCRVDTSEQHAPGAEAKRKVDSAKKEESSSGHFSEESEEEVIEETVAPLGGKGHRRPPEPDGPPPKQKKDGNGRKERHRHQAGNTSSCKGSKPRHRAGRKHQRLGRLEFDPTVKVHRKLSGHFLDTLATDAGKDSFKQAAMSGRPHSEGEEFNLHDLE